LHQVGDLFELNVKLRCQKVNGINFSLQQDIKIQRREQGLLPHKGCMAETLP
jgi:hypothetical protein